MIKKNFKLSYLLWLYKALFKTSNIVALKIKIVIKK